MHELSIALSILDMAEEEAQRHSSAPESLHAIHLRLGPLSGVLKEALQSAYDLARESTPLPQCRLLIDDVPITAHCPLCNTDCTVASIQQLTCPHCGTPTPDILTGRELEVTALEFST